MNTDTTNRSSSSTAIDALAGRNIVVVATGSIGTAFLPVWLPWLRYASPDTHVRVVLTRAAEAFVGSAALKAFAGGPIRVDDWDTSDGEPLHVEMNSWADAYLVHPATMNFVSRFATGLCDSPYMLAMQGFAGPVVIAAAGPPGFVDSPVWNRYEEAVKHRYNVSLIKPAEGYSVADPKVAGSPATPFPLALGRLAEAMKRSRS